MAARKVFFLLELLGPSPYLKQDIVLGSKRDHWVHPINLQRDSLGEYHHLIPQLLDDEDRYRSYYRMSPETFTTLMDILRPVLTKTETSFRRPISAEERMTVTLR